MLPPYNDKEEGWQEWLKEMDLWEDALSEDQLYLRYRRFRMVKFGISTKYAKEFMHDLLIIEDFLVWGSSIGLA